MADGEGVELLRVEQARAWLAECIKVDECKDFRDKAQAVAAYKRSRGASKEAQADAWELVQRADRRLGELLKEVAPDPGRPKKNGTAEVPFPPKLSDLGISKNQSSRWQKKADLPEPVFEQRLAAKRAKIAHKAENESLTNASDDEEYDGNEASTPAKYVELAREVLGGRIGIDPASNAYAQNVVRADRFYTKQDSGLLVDWRSEAGTLWLQPPYDPKNVQAFVEKYLNEQAQQHFTASVALFNASTETGWFQSMIGASDALCLPDHRIQFEYKGEPIQGSNRYAQAFFYYGPNVNGFLKAFSTIGKVLVPLRGTF